MNSFKINDRVVCIRNIDRDEIIIGMKGTVIQAAVDDDDTVGVDWDDEHREGHICNGYARPLHGYYVVPDDIKLYESKTFKVSSNGSYKIIKKKIK